MAESGDQENPESLLGKRYSVNICHHYSTAPYETTPSQLATALAFVVHLKLSKTLIRCSPLSPDLTASKYHVTCFCCVDYREKIARDFVHLR